MRYAAINAICAGGDTVPIVRDTASTLAYTVFENMRAAAGEAYRLNEAAIAERKRIDAEAADEDEDDAEADDALLKQLNGMLPKSLRAD
jgi:hypothetical protein